MGADYKKNHASIIGAQSVNTLAVNSTRYLNPGGSNFQPTEPPARMRIPFSCVIRNLYVRATFAPGAGETYDYEILVNGAPSGIACQIAGAIDVEANDLVNVVGLVLGDEICLEVITSLNASVRYHGMSIELNR